MARCALRPPMIVFACLGAVWLGALIFAVPDAEASLAHDLARWSVDAVAFLLPRLDTVTRTEWLIYGLPAAPEYLGAIGSLLLYTALLVAAGLFDFHRKNL